MGRTDGPRAAELGTRCVHGLPETDSETRLGRPVALPIAQTSTFAFDSPDDMFEVFTGRRPGFVYSRYSNPTVEAVEQKLAAIDGAERALLFSSGMAAISTLLLHLVRPGERVVATHDLYGGTRGLLGSFAATRGIRIDWVDPEDAESVNRALSTGPKLFFLESPTNPLLRVLDVPVLLASGRAHGVATVLDSTFGPPGIQQPTGWGVDYTFQSATKYLGGHSDLLCGVVSGSRERIEALEGSRRALGGIVEALTAYLLDRSLKTLHLRVRRQSSAAAELAGRLERAQGVLAVHHPSLGSHPHHARAERLMGGHGGGVFAFEVEGGRDGAVRFLRGLRWIGLATSLGGAETLASHPATSSHIMLSPEERARSGIGEGLIRLSVGLEDIEDLWSDLERGLGALAG